MSVSPSLSLSPPLSSSPSSPSPSLSSSSCPPLSHSFPSSLPLVIFDEIRSECVIPNSPELHIVDNKYFCGVSRIRIRPNHFRQNENKSLYSNVNVTHTHSTVSHSNSTSLSSSFSSFSSSSLSQDNDNHHDKDKEEIDGETETEAETMEGELECGALVNSISPCDNDNQSNIISRNGNGNGNAIKSADTSSSSSPAAQIETFFLENPKIQFDATLQGRFRTPPVGVLYIGAELHQREEKIWEGKSRGRPRPFQISYPFIKRQVLKMLLGIISSMVSGLHYTFGTEAKKGNEQDGNDNDMDMDGEFPLVSFPLVKSADRFVVTPKGQTPPSLPLSALPEGIFNKKEFTSSYRFDSDSTYTFNFFSANLDLVNWKAKNIPHVADIELESFWHKHSVSLVLYELRDINKNHSKSNRNVIFNYNIAHNKFNSTTEK